MDGFDFNIQNYSLSEMEDLLGLAAKRERGKGYTPDDVASCKQRLCMTLASSGKQDTKMPFHRNFTYYIDKRNWKYYFLMLALCKGY